MKRTLVIIILAILVAASAAIAMGGLSTKKVSFTLEDISRNQVNLDSYINDKVVLLAFFTTWCPWCQEEMPILQAIYDKYRSKGLEVVGIGINESRETLTAFVNANKLTFKMLIDEKGKVAAHYRIRKIPSILIIDKTGRLRFKALYVTVDTLENELNKVLK